MKVYTAGRPQPPHLQLAPALSFWSKQMDMKSSCEELPGMNNITLTCPLEQNKLTACMCRHEPGGAVFEIGVCVCVSGVCGKMSDPRRPNQTSATYSHVHTNCSQVTQALPVHICPTDRCCFSCAIIHLPVLTDTQRRAQSGIVLTWEARRGALDGHTVSNNLAML